MLDQNQAPSRIHRAIMIVLYLITLAATVLIVMQGWEYYVADHLDRPHMELHPLWKAGGPIGHGLGILGSLLMLLMMLYIPRKRMRKLQGLGKLSQWLNVHIWMGVTAPILITFHSTFKFGGIVAVSYWSMMAVALSGVLGRYIYLQIPRTLSGQELGERDLDAMDTSLREELEATPGIDDELLTVITRTMSAGGTKGASGLGAVFRWIAQDLSRPFRTRNLKVLLRRKTDLDAGRIKDVLDLARRRALLIRRRAFLTVARSLLHYWHVIHRPFALIMFIIMFIHIGVAVLFGYTWLF